MSFSLSETKGRLRPFRVLRSTLESTGGDAAPKDVVVAEFVLEIGGPEVDHRKFDAALEALHRGIVSTCREIAGDDDAGGCEINSSTKLPPLSVTIHGLPEAERQVGVDPIVEVINADVRGKPKVKVSEKGDAVLVLKVRCRVSPESIARAFSFVEADVWIAARPTQIDMSDVVEAKASPKTTRRKRA